ncbi:MAG: glutathione S-transferase family protein [Pseudomonadota bacterium]
MDLVVELFHNPISTCSQKVRLCLAEKKIDYQSRVINFANQEHLSDEYLHLNPNGVVPTLIHNGRAIVDSSVICEYLDEVFPDPRLSPPTALERANMRAWMRYLEEVPTTAIRVPSFNMLFANNLAKIPESDFREMTDRMPLRKAFYRQLKGEDGFDKSLYEDSLDKLRGTLARADNTLSENDWLVGDQFTIADIVLTPTIVRMDDIGLSDMWAKLPHFSRWYNDIRERPSFETAFFAGSRVDPKSFSL